MPPGRSAKPSGVFGPKRIGASKFLSSMTVPLTPRRRSSNGMPLRMTASGLSGKLTLESQRRVTEELHPTLLDNVGLFAALRWQVQNFR